ncbi:unnamed protein product [Mytilus coruscus]|uniref:Reverse transcriptase domain-containing protein n=1 Tax=Mytilus coruscus TaxID=42192 RepID=A0A6J8B3R4_MYTCO|nr:unnamed protein product [Mytilus coruscus]
MGGKYIDFHSLFENDETKYRLQLVQGADNPELSITEERNKKTLTLNQWLSAWNKFTAIICTKNPELGKLLERGEAQWGCTHLELYLRAKLQGNVKSGNDNNKSGNTRWPVGVCFSFHKGLGYDFMIVDKTEDGCKKKLERFLAICKDMGIPISKEKTFQPSRVMSFVGYEIDTRLMEVRLPIDKLAKCHNLKP